MSCWVGLAEVECEVGLRQEFDAVDEFGIVGLGVEVTVPDVAVADAEVERVFVEAFEVFGEVCVIGFEVADHAGHDGFVGHDVEYPLVIFEQGAAFEFYRTDDIEAFDQIAEEGRGGGFVDGAIFGRPGNAAGAVHIEEVDVAVDDGDGWGCQGSGGGGGEEGPAIHAALSLSRDSLIRAGRLGWGCRRDRWR